jgi:Zn-finger nucleic acid-binding protein
MRLLVACTRCQRRYEAAPEKIGSRFRCHCGQVLRVRQPKGHEAAVVRCSSCGGAREKGLEHCTYCRADFTLHERDLDTVCPRCFARVSDRARYCPQCATHLTAEMLAGEETTFVCPVCADDRHLQSRQLGHEQVSVLECQRCTGLWLGTQSFLELRNRTSRAAEHLRDALRGQPRPQRLQDHAGPLYRHCVRCRKLMSRRQYARGSGIIIDICRDHGIWFDADELQQVLDWIARGGDPRNPVLQRAARERADRADALPSPHERSPTTRRRDRDWQTGSLDDIVSGVLGQFVSLFG